MKIALVHDYLLEAGGAERVLRVLAEMYPKAPIYTAFAKNGTAKAMFGDRIIRESKWAWMLKIGRLYSYGRFLLPWVWKSVDLTKFDVVITSCSGYIARGFRVKQSARVIAYCHTPPRWLYGHETPTGAQTKWWGKLFMWVVGPYIRYFDFKSAARVNCWIANSENVKNRIAKYYRKEAVVVYPPIEIVNGQWTMINKKQNYYLVVSRIVGGKRIMEAAQAFKQRGIKLKIVGEVIDIKLGKRVECLGRVSDSELAKLYAGARGFVALARDEDFGMTVVEAMSYGTPVLAYYGGGYKETVIEGKTGVFVRATDAKSVAEGIAKMEKIKWDRETIKTWASKFDRVSFEKGIRGIINA